MDRRTFLKTSALAGVAVRLKPDPTYAGTTAVRLKPDSTSEPDVDIAAIDRARVLAAARRYLSEQPLTVTAASSPRSAGGRHDFFSEGDYWWPDPNNPDGPYVQRDGMTNPDNFVAHRKAMVRLSLHVPALAAAWLLTSDRRFAQHAASHLRAWFVDDETRMNPNLQYAQAIHGRFTGRGTGIIDTLHLVEVARAASVVERASVLTDAERGRVRRWFDEYVTWMTTHKYGTDERDAKNNHGSCWVLQVAEFARLAGRPALLDYCRDRFKTVLVPGQIAADGSFPEELRRTKPYGYCLFNLDALTTICQALSTPTDNLWTFKTPERRGIEDAVAFMFPFIADKKSWPAAHDVMYFDQWPVRQPSLLFAGLAYSNPKYIALWRTLNPDPTEDEIIRNFFIRQPLLWVHA
jgi:hypothetical protein